MPSSLVIVAGSDNIQPVYNPNSRWTTFNINEIFVPGGVGAGRYVPNPNDLIEDLVANTTYIVKSVNPVTLLTNKVVLRTYATPLSSDFDLLSNGGPGTYRAYVNRNVTPNVLAIDSRFIVAGTDTSYAMVFKGRDTSINGKLIGYTVNTSGLFNGNQIPLSLVASSTTQTNLTVKRVTTCYTNEPMDDGEVITVVVYSDTGSVITVCNFTVMNTAFIQALANSTRYVTGISLQSSFLSNSQVNTIAMPLNTPVGSLNMMGVVQYNDGSTVTLPVDGTVFSMSGLESYVTTVVGQSIPLVLSYKLSTNEVAFQNTSFDGTVVSVPYTLITTTQNGSYNVKLFVYPEWINANTGYKLRWYLYNLDRNIFYDVTTIVGFNPNSAMFNPLGYGTSQQMLARINLHDVSPSFDNFVHVQTVIVTLIDQATARSSNWLVSYAASQTTAYGAGLFAHFAYVNPTSYNVKISNGIVNFSDWINKVYYNAMPLSNPLTETRAPLPTHFAIISGGNTNYFPISNWNSTLNVSGPVTLNSTIYIRFISRAASTPDVELCVSGMQVIEW